MKKREKEKTGAEAEGGGGGRGAKIGGRGTTQIDKQPAHNGIKRLARLPLWKF